MFGQASGLLCSPDRPAASAAFVRSRLSAWRHTDTGAVLPGYWTTRVNDVATAKSARPALPYATVELAPNCYGQAIPD
jgi:hypothetical protein